MYYCLWTTVHVFVSTVSEIKVYIYIQEYIVDNIEIIEVSEQVVDNSNK